MTGRFAHIELEELHKQAEFYRKMAALVESESVAAWFIELAEEAEEEARRRAN